jgi:hypothetical protein
MIAEAAVHEAVKTGRALGDANPVTAEDLWDRVAADMSEKPYKGLGVDLLTQIRWNHERAVDGFIRADLRLTNQRAEGREHAREIQARFRTEAVKRGLAGQIDAFSEAIVRNGEAVMGIADHVREHLATLRDSMQRTRQRIEQAAGAQNRAEVEAGRISAAVQLTAGRKAWLIEDLDAYLDGKAGKRSDRGRELLPESLVAEWDMACDGDRDSQLS